MCKVILLYSNEVYAMKGVKDLNNAALLSVYKGLLTEKQQDIMEQYYWDDLSLGEIAENLGITRQAVMDGIRRSEKRLNELEKQLGLFAKTQTASEIFSEIKRLAGEMNRSDGRNESLASNIIELAEKGTEIF